ncbi:antibiotic biosynthesis monooxygenase [Sinomonas sp. ASV322]|uniref:putative quinol monooxygenase n=1 Tax=Sinomonas sp. ASV322 TaxID=3041920 RepID=UPI0027DCB9FF|nr:antibiotic biosynthesis monooxygenase [Sinomonas sp. ASV322]MDQ4503434.1 antibiotic biosynthesis monooxygenase [Sinomonas sp. ASV322]
MTEIRLHGLLVCRDDNDIAVVVDHLERHIALTRAENGCVSFCVTPTDDPLVWQVEELFRDAGAFKAHQDRVASSEWGRATAGIERRYTIEGL